MSVFSERFSCTRPIEPILAGGYKGIILSGGPASVYEDAAPLPPKALFDSGIPILGICYGMQAMGYLLGGHVDRKSTRLNSSHTVISYAVFCLKKKKKEWHTIG